jgi:hypothetical protein
MHLCFIMPLSGKRKLDRSNAVLFQETASAVKFSEEHGWGKKQQIRAAVRSSRQSVVFSLPRSRSEAAIREENCAGFTTGKRSQRSTAILAGGR